MTRKTRDAAATDFGEAVGRLNRRLRAESAMHRLSWTETSVMARLDREGPATTAELARAEGVKPQSMGATIAALEDAGMVERKAHLTDGRRVIIALTTHGVAVRKSTKDARWSWLVRAMAELDRDEREVLSTAGGIIKRLAES